MLLTSSTKLLKMLKLLSFPLVFQERSVSYSTSSYSDFELFLLLQPGVSLNFILFVKYRSLALTYSIYIDDP